MQGSELAREGVEIISEELRLRVYLPTNVEP